METSFLQQFKLEIEKIIFDNVNELDKASTLNNLVYQRAITGLANNVVLEAKTKELEESYLKQIREFWKLHLFFLDALRKTYNHCKFKKLNRPIPFSDSGLTASIELFHSITPLQNNLMKLDEHQTIYWQYLEFIKILEAAMYCIEVSLCEELGIKTNFPSVKDSQTGEFAITYNSNEEFMIDPVIKENLERITELREAEIFVRKVLDEVYKDANPAYYDWLVKSILKYPFPEVEIPDVGQNNASFVVDYVGTKTDIYKKVKFIKRNIYPKKTGASEILAKVFYDSTKNFGIGDCRVLKTALLRSKM